MIHVRPASERRRDFARWATGHTVKLRTVGPDVFAVPPHLFVDVPEELLVGAIVDGRRYRSPLEDEATGSPPPGVVVEQVDELVGVAALDGLREAVPGQPLPDAAAASSYPPGAVPLPPPDLAPLEDIPGDNPAGGIVVVGETGPETVVPLGDTSGDVLGTGGDTFACDRCPRTFTTARGRDTHRRQAHTED